ncbi:DNA translocase FtsK [Mesobacillus selenatarsenatis]|uniref:Cell division protein FtsK n=1 Tax=Mesobacillus selenatarsenatis (strain DSM 18680 / JCM 14380 / FERM P-15431 / SF-1) TaxID=1321606 RepID=A0A0A8WYH6_MESS1|nr:DNA translocase FtsK [Mesobacillus selenatarsenatis]GAM12765.1 cell division protein FtsK [Mesobacillus selenatarsenatis SF-1]
MSWIKKIFTMFQNDDEFNDIEQDQPVSRPLKKEQNEKRDIEAKVLYQYPKGQFRFPLIPDEDSVPEKSKQTKGRPERVIQDGEIKPFIKEQGSLKIKNERQTESDSFHNQRREPAVDSRSKVRRDTAREPIEPYKPKKAVESAPKFHYETRKDSGPKFRQPFKPTEIPSPIYAFNRPPRKSMTQMDLEDVEYELAGFEKDQSSAVKQIKHDDINIMSQAMDLKEAHVSTESHDETVTQDIYIEDDLAETQNLEVTEVDEQVEQSELETEALDIIFNSEPGPEYSSVDSQIETMTEVELEQGAEKTELVGYQHDQEETEASGMQSKPEEAEAISIQNSPEEDEVNGYEQSEDELNVQPVDVAKVQNTKTEESFEASEPEHSPDPEPKIEDKPAEPKRQLPFNVLMLKQDKRKWEERNTSKYPSFMTEGKKTSAHQTHPDVDAPSSDVSGQKNQVLEDELSAGSTSSVVLPVQQEQPSAAQQETLIVAEKDASVADNQQKTLSVEVSPVTVPSKSEEQTQAEPAVANSSSAQMNRQFEREEIQSNDREAAIEPEVHPAAVYDFPPLELLSPPVFKAPDPEWLSEQEHMLNETLRNFNVGARVVNVTQGPSVTRFEVQPEPGVKVNKVTNLSDDIKLSLAAKDIRIEAPIPGKHTIGIEVPNHSSRPVLLSEILQSAGFMDLESPLSVALGLDIAGNPIVTDLKKMPHGLIAGATGSGKSVCINTMLVSLLYKAHPDEVKLLLIDPKMVELAPYNRIPHLVSPVITDVKAATASLKWAVEEMERRYELFAHTGVRDIGRFNELAEKHRRFSDKLPYIVIVIDELADLMMMAPGDVEEAICRIAQKARACGIHLIIATQRPSVDVITGLIKANVPTRIAFSVSSQVDSRTIIDISGAEKLLGRGDMLFLENGSSKPFRLQGTFVTDNEIDDIVAFVREQRDPQYLFEQDELLKKAQVTEDEDELFYEACEFVIDQGGASTSSVQRRFKIGYNRAARLIEMMEHQGFISEGKGSKPRDVLITAADLEALQETSTFN